MSGAWREYLTALSERQWALIAAALLLIGSGAYLLWTDASEPIVIVQHTATAPSATEIAGLSAAAQRTPLRNPFTHAHEHMGETSPAPVAAVNEGAVPSNPPPAPAAAVQVPPARVASPAPIVLRGVVTGADGTRIAILAKGTESAALSCGESWQGHTLRAVTDTAVTLDTASGTITLTRE